jgi:hypothetical protein
MKVRARLRVSAAKKMNLNVGLPVNFKHPKAEIKGWS